MILVKQALTLVLALSALALAPGAVAKGPFTLEVCGSSACERVPSESGDAALFGLLDIEFNVPLDALVSQPPLAPYYDVRFEADWVPREVSFFVPSAGVLQTGANWVLLDADGLATLERLTRGLEPWPQPALERVRVDGREAADAAPYEDLFGLLAPADWPAEPGEPVAIEPDFGRATPWTGSRLRYFPRDGLLWRNDEILRAPEELAQAIRRDAGLADGPAPAVTAPATPADADGSSFPWELILAVAAGAGLLAGAALVAVRIGRRGGFRSSA
jgi:hypothetical protein